MVAAWCPILRNGWRSGRSRSAFTRPASHTYSSRLRACAPSVRQSQTTPRRTRRVATAQDAMKTIVRRLRRLENQLGTADGKRAADIPKPLETLSPEDRVLLRPYHEAQERGNDSDIEWPPEVYRAEHRYLVATFEHTKRLREAGVPMLRSEEHTSEL